MNDVGNYADQVQAVLPNHDETTRMLRRLLLPFFASPPCHVSSESPDAAEYDTLLDRLNSGIPTIFSGHAGVEDLRIGLNRTISGRHVAGKWSIFAYCCSAASQLAGFVREKNGFFIGYSRKIPFAMKAEGELADIFAGPVATILTSGISGMGKVELQKWYRQNLREMKSRERLEKYELAVILCLELHLELLD